MSKWLFLLLFLTLACSRMIIESFQDRKPTAFQIFMMKAKRQSYPTVITSQTSQVLLWLALKRLAPPIHQHNYIIRSGNETRQMPT